MKNFILLLTLAILTILPGCGSREDIVPDNSDNITMLFEDTSYPNISEHNGKFYFIRQDKDIKIYEAENIDSLAAAKPITVWEGPAKGMNNIWAPEMIRINGKWYIYFEADDGNTDNHQLYVIENSSENPTQGEWTLHGPIITNDEWNFGIHPSSFMIGRRQFLLWSGWEHRRSETETQCIFIAEMENPWTLKSPRILISKPEYEWERQWINPDGTRSAYPIFVNENPEPVLSPDGKKIAVAYSASGIWTQFATIGLIYADTSSDLLDPASWKKLEEPQSNPGLLNESMTGITNISTINSTDGKCYMLFQAKDFNNGEKECVFKKAFRWTNKGYPDFGFNK